MVIIGITGTLGAGKGTIVEFLLNKGFKHYSARSFLYEELDRRGLEHNRDNLIATANDLRAKHGPSYVAESLFERAKQSGGKSIIESLRTVGEVQALRDKGDFLLFAVDAPREIRYERVSQRGSSTDKISFEKFSEQEEREMKSDDPTKQNLSACIAMADKVFINDGSKEDLLKQVDAFLKEKNII